MCMGGYKVPQNLFYILIEDVIIMNNQEQHPMSEYLLKLQLLVSNTEFKNKEIADKYETVEARLNGEAYVRAKLGQDIFESYKWDDAELASMLNELGFTIDQIQRMVNNPACIPPSTMNLLLSKKRKELMDNYVEPNKYYVNLMGLPFEGSSTVNADPYIEVPYEFYQMYQDSGAFGPAALIHMLPSKYMELFLASQYYPQLLNQYPDVEYLKHLGSYAIPIEKSRPAHDGDILTINTTKLHTYHKTFGDVKVSSDMIHLFTNVYEKVQSYVYNTLRGNFAMIYANYNSFIRFLTIYMTIGNCLNECMKRSTSMIYMNKATMNDFFMLYGLPSVIMDGSDSMMEFLKKFRLLLMDKGTNTVYRVKDIIGYEYTDIYTLIMVKQQAFKNGKPMFYVDENGKHQPVQDIVFRRFGTAEDNTSYFKFRDSNKTYSLEEITSGDPRWWNTPEVEEMIQTMNYTLSNSKYIQLSTSMSMDDIWYQSTILLRGLMDNRLETKSIIMNIDYNINGIQQLSIFEAVLSLIIAMNWKHTDFRGQHFNGNLYIPNGVDWDHKPACVDVVFEGNGKDTHDLTITHQPYKISSFNFEVKSQNAEWYQSLPYQLYLNPSEFIPMLESILQRESSNLGESIMSDIYNLYKYLQTKLFEAKTIHEFREVEEAYKNLFLVDPLRLQWFDMYQSSTEEILMQNYKLTQSDLNVFKTILEYDTNKIDMGDGLTISPYDIMNNDVLTLPYPFDQPVFVNAYCDVVSKYTDSFIENYSALNPIIRSSYRNILQDKVLLDTSNSEYGPRTFEALMLRINPDIYKGLKLMQNNSASLVLLIKSIIRALESYTNTKLTALQMQSLGADEYIRILKEVITYFKSYMVEFTKDEFTYIFGGPFDRGGNSDMLSLYDEIHHITLHMIPRDVIRLHDASHAYVKYGFKEDFNHFVYDDAIFRIKTTYKKLKDMGYTVWFDTGQRVTQKPFRDLTDDSEVIGNLVWDKESTTYVVILSKNNVVEDNYYGNVRP